MKKDSIDHMYYYIAVVAALLFIPFLGHVHLFDWDEINFAESAREMIQSGDYLTVQVNFQPFWEKPPLFIWMQVVSMKLFGINEFAARFPNAICGIITLLSLYHIGKKLISKQMGILWTLCYAGSVLPFFYFKSGIIDPWFNLFIFLGIYQFYNYLKNYKIISAILSAFFIGAGILTKGPVALLMFLIVIGVVLIYKKFSIKWIASHIISFLLVLIAVGGLWFILQIAIGNYTIIQDFIVYQIRLLQTKDAGHGGFLLYHFVIVFFGVFPASAFAIPAHKFLKTRKEKPYWLFIFMMISLLWAVLIVFTIVKTKIVHYSSLTYFPLTFLAAFFIYEWVNNKIKLTKTIKFLLILSGSVISIALLLVAFIGNFTSIILSKDLIKDRFAAGNLSAEVPWNGFEFLIGIVVIIGIVGFLRKAGTNKFQSIYILFSCNLVAIFFASIIITPKVEGYSQRAAINFFKNKAQQDVYLQPLFKSYAHYFYGAVKPHENENAYSLDWLTSGKIDKDAYFLGKVHREDSYEKKYPELIKIGEKNGYIFYKRNAKTE